PSPPSGSPDSARPAGPLLALERRGLARGDIAPVRRALRASGRKEHRPEDVGRAGLAGPLDHGGSGRPARRPGPGAALSRSAGRPAQPAPPDAARLAHHRAADSEGRSDEPAARLGAV